MRGICPNCERVTGLSFLEGREEIEVRGEAIAVNVHYYRCRVCGVEFDDPQSPHDPLDEAYREYRARHGMLQPEDIREFRHRHGLSQKQLSELLGWGAVTLSRYENGALHSESHERALRLAILGGSPLGFVQSNPEAVERQRRT